MMIGRNIQALWDQEQLDYHFDKWCNFSGITTSITFEN